MEIAATEPPTPPDPEGGASEAAAASSADSPGHESRCLGTFQRFAAQFGEDIPQSDMTYYAARCCARSPFNHPEFVADILPWIYDLDAASFRGAVQSFRGALTYDNLNQLRQLEGRDGPEGHNAKIVHFLKSGGVLGYQVLCGAILAMNPMLHHHRHEAMVRLLRSCIGRPSTEAKRPATPALRSDLTAENVRGSSDRISSTSHLQGKTVFVLLDEKLKKKRAKYKRFIKLVLKSFGYEKIDFDEMESETSGIEVDDEGKKQVLISVTIDGPPDESRKANLGRRLRRILGSYGDVDIDFMGDYASSIVVLALGRHQAELFNRILFLYPGVLAGFGILEVIHLASLEIVDLRAISRKPLAWPAESEEMREKRISFAETIKPFVEKDYVTLGLGTELGYEFELPFQSVLLNMTEEYINDDDYLSAICDLIQMESGEEKVPSFLEEPNSKRRAPTPTLTEATHTESSGKSSASTIDPPHFLDTSLGYDFRAMQDDDLLLVSKELGHLLGQHDEDVLLKHLCHTSGMMYGEFLALARRYRRTRILEGYPRSSLWAGFKALHEDSPSLALRCPYPRSSLLHAPLHVWKTTSPMPCFGVEIFKALHEDSPSLALRCRKVLGLERTSRTDLSYLSMETKSRAATATPQTQSQSSGASFASSIDMPHLLDRHVGYNFNAMFDNDFLRVTKELGYLLDNQGVQNMMIRLLSPIVREDVVATVTECQLSFYKPREARSLLNAALHVWKTTSPMPCFGIDIFKALHEDSPHLALRCRKVLGLLTTSRTDLLYLTQQTPSRAVAATPQTQSQSSGASSASSIDMPHLLDRHVGYDFYAMFDKDLLLVTEGMLKVLSQQDIRNMMAHLLLPIMPDDVLTAVTEYQLSMTSDVDPLGPSLLYATLHFWKTISPMPCFGVDIFNALEKDSSGLAFHCRNALGLAETSSTDLSYLTNQTPSPASK